jgi:hypothetical protein
LLNNTYGVISPTLFSEHNTQEFKYKLKLDKDLIDHQATIFSEEVDGNKVLSDLVYKASDKKIDKISLVKEVYIYSLLKAYYAIYDIQINGQRNISHSLSRSLIFYGHNELLLHGIEHTIHNKNNSISDTITVKKVLELDTLIPADSDISRIYAKCVNPAMPGRFFSSTYEKVLDTFHMNSQELLLETIGNRDSIAPDSSPLGNMSTFPSEDASVNNKLLFVTDPKSLTDHISKFWNIACYNMY